MMLALMIAAALSLPQGDAGTTVGYPGSIDELVLEGPQLKARALGVASPVVLRIVHVFPHGDAFRYDLEYYGLDPGEYDLRDYLERPDGSSLDDLPPIPVTITSVLPPGQILPNQQEVDRAASRFAYRTRWILAALAWVVVGFGLFFMGRKSRREEAAIEAGKPLTLAQRLRPMVEEAVAGQLAAERRAELEMTLITYWRRRLGLGDQSPGQVIAILRKHDEAGPLVRGLEDWLHRPDPPQEVDVAALLRPYESLPDDTPAVAGT